MTIDWESASERIAPVALKICRVVVAVVTFVFGTAQTLVGAGFLIFAAAMLRLPDALLRVTMQGRWASVSDQRNALVALAAAGIAVLIWGLHTLHDLFQPHKRQAARVAELESKLVEVRQFADEAAQFAEEGEWATGALAAVAEVFKIDGVLEAARRAARKALHPDAHPGAGEPEIRDLTERFQMAEAVFDRFSN